MAIHVEVTAEDIERGIPVNACACPVARALRRVTGKLWLVNRTSASLVDDGGTTGFLLPAAVRQFTREFDRGQPVAPINFDLEA